MAITNSGTFNQNVNGKPSGGDWFSDDKTMTVRSGGKTRTRPVGASADVPEGLARLMFAQMIADDTTE
jgi:hypothetical protein